MQRTAPKALRWAVTSGVLLTAFSLSASQADAWAATNAGTSTIETVAGGRFNVSFDAEAQQAAAGAKVDLAQLVARSLEHINALLPGPPASIVVAYQPVPGQLIPQAGTYGQTNEPSGSVFVTFGHTQKVPLRQALEVWLPRMLSHEVDHSVRILAGPGFGTSLLAVTVSEGISSVFDEAAFPGPPNPSDNTISQGQQCTLWREAQPLLSTSRLYYWWMFAGPYPLGTTKRPRVPYWTGFTIGYHIVADYVLRHPHVSWAELTRTSAPTILAGSGYQPCAPVPSGKGA